MLVTEKLFSLSLYRKDLTNIYGTHVGSLVLYGSELQTLQERQSLKEVDDELVRTFLKGLLKFKSTTLSTKRKTRLLLILRIYQRYRWRWKRCVWRVSRCGRSVARVTNKSCILHDTIAGGYKKLTWWPPSTSGAGESERSQIRVEIKDDKGSQQ